MPSWSYPRNTRVQFTEKCQEIEPKYVHKTFRVLSYSLEGGTYTIEDRDSGSIILADRSAIESTVAAPNYGLSRQDALTQIIVAHSFPHYRYVEMSSLEVKVKCRCGVSISDTAPELFGHAQHIAEEIEKVVGRDL